MGNHCALTCCVQTVSGTYILDNGNENKVMLKNLHHRVEVLEQLVGRLLRSAEMCGSVQQVDKFNMYSNVYPDLHVY